MSADVLSETLAELGRGDEIAVAERLKTAAVELASLLDDLPGDNGKLTEERVADLLAVTSDAGESFLAVAFPVVEYGQAAALEALPRALRHVIGVTAAARTDQTARRIAAVPAVGRLVWALAGFALHCDKPAALVTVSRARLTAPLSNKVQPVVALISLRHPDAFDRDADKTFRDYHGWLSALPLLERYPMFAAEFDAALLEGDLLLAMQTGRFRGGVYSRGRERDTVRRLAARVDDAAQRQALDQLFPGEGELEPRLEQAYAATADARNRFECGPSQLFGEE